ncbi:MAG: GYD domain-containing protein [Anaerolineae bacterium]|nr:GYD domain-containing protein [Anaerolineae bacterium]MDQ7036493.1 GYD domain-containing protein [Anaerolineae bacterium]
MPTYIIQGNYTQQGAKNMKGSPERLDAVKQAVQAAGGDVKGFYLTMGQYDMLMIVDMPNDEALLKMVISAAGEGNVSTEPFRAFTEDEYRALAANL